MTDLEEKFYSEPLYLSYSALNLLLFSPRAYYQKYALGNRVDFSTQATNEGRLIHCLLLDEEKFNEQFIVTPGSLPPDNQKAVVDKLYSRVKDGPGLLENYTIEILDILKEINLHQSLTDDKVKVAKMDVPSMTGDQKRLDKILTEQNKSYFEFLKRRNGKTIVDNETLERCKVSVLILKENEKINDLLGSSITGFEDIKVYNEKELKARSTGKLKLKGIVDNIKIDHYKQIIYINDLKTTSKTISDFNESVEFYNYWIQAAIYERLILYNFGNLIIKGYKIIFNFIVIDKYQQVYPFWVTPETMQKWQLRLSEKLKEAEWHYINKDYNLPFKFAVGEVTL